MTGHESQAPDWKTIEPLLDHALGLDTEAREAWLVALRSTDPQAAAALRKMLAERDALDAQGFLVQSPFAAFAPTLANRQVGGYTVERLIGRGGMGEVWLARRSDGRYEGHCAIKLLDAGLASTKTTDRFQREGNLLARLSHPHIARLLDAGTVEGRAYLALEYVEGERIDRFCERLGVRARVRLFVDVVAAVAHAHSQLVVHRDLKPSNVMVTRDGQVKLLDFGIAKLLSADTQSEESEPTRLEDVALTPEYAAPEQMLGDQPSTATDVYQLGMLLYVLLTGRLPREQTGTRAEKMRAALDGDIPRASDAAQPQCRRELQGDLDAILAMAVRRNPAERYATAQGLKDDLLRFLGNEPVAARRGATLYRLKKLMTRHRVATAATVATALALVVGIVGVSWQARAAQRARVAAEASATEATQQRDTARFEARVATANKEFMSQVFGEAMAGGETARMGKRLDHARELLKARYSDDPEVHAMLLMQLAGRYAELELPQREAEVMAQLRGIAAAGTDYTLKAQLECIESYDLIRSGDTDSAAPHITNGLQLMKQARRPVEAAFECWRAEAMLAAVKGNSQRAVARMEELLRWIEREGRQETRLYLSALGSLAYIHELSGDFSHALEVSRTALALHVTLGSNDTLSSFEELRRQSNALYELGRLQEAVAADSQLAAQIRAQDAGAEIPPVFLVNMARNALANDEPGRAIPWLTSLAQEYARNGPERYARGTLLDLADAQLLAGNGSLAIRALQGFESRLAKSPARPRELIESSRIQLWLALADRAGKSTLAVRRRKLLEAMDAAPRMNRIVLLKGRLVAGLAALRIGEIDGASAQADIALQLTAQKDSATGVSAWVGVTEVLQAKIATAKDAPDVANQHYAAARRQFEGTLPAAHWLRAQIPPAP